jgi:hypothetical protein
MERDLPHVVAEVTAEFTAYEQALVDNDVDRIVGFFAADAVRFGIADQQADLAEQARWRRAQVPVPAGPVAQGHDDPHVRPPHRGRHHPVRLSGQ